jgi:hypothetical protein
MLLSALTVSLAARAFAASRAQLLPNVSAPLRS